MFGMSICKIEFEGEIWITVLSILASIVHCCSLVSSMRSTLKARFITSPYNGEVLPGYAMFTDARFWDYVP